MGRIYKPPKFYFGMSKGVFNPWEVSGDVNYEKLVKDFGISPLKELGGAFEKELLFRRGIIFAHRDIQRVLDTAEKKKPFVMMTGLMPTGRFHIGHMILARQFVFWQELGAKIYIAVADIEAYNARGQSLEESKKIAMESYIPGYIAMGLKPKNCEIYFQSARSKDAKKSNAYYRLQNLLARHATFNEFKAVYGSIEPGKIVSSLLQASDMLHPQLKEFEKAVPVVVPVGIDQDPHLRLARDISQRIKNPKFLQLSSTYHYFAPGLKGGKMSASDPNSYIDPMEDEKSVRKKINKYAFSGGRPTLEEHKKLGGNPDIDVSFQYLRMLLEENDSELKEIYDAYKSGEMTTGELKAITIDKMNSLFKKFQKNKKLAEKKIDKFLD